MNILNIVFSIGSTQRFRENKFTQYRTKRTIQVVLLINTVMQLSLGQILKYIYNLLMNSMVNFDCYVLNQKIWIN